MNAENITVMHHYDRVLINAIVASSQTAANMYDPLPSRFGESNVV